MAGWVSLGLVRTTTTAPLLAYIELFHYSSDAHIKPKTTSPTFSSDAMEDVGILRRGADRVSVEKIARFFLAEFKSTLKSGGKWLNELDKEEQKRVKASRRAQLGADLLSLSTDLPFKFPPTFTFVFRAFTSLDGIGKGLDERYDLTRLAQPFLKELIELRDGSATVSLLKDWQKKLGWRPQDLAAVVQSPRKVAQIEDTLRRAEQGDLKLRVRVLESERAFKRIDIVQQTMVNAIMASMFLNAGIVLTAAGVAAPGQGTRVAGRLLFTLAGLFGLKIPISYLKLASFDKKSVELGLVQKT